MFGRKKKETERIVFDPSKQYPAIRCSICTGEQVLCAKERSTGKLIEIMLIRNPAQLEAVCEENGFSADGITKIY